MTNSGKSQGRSLRFRDENQSEYLEYSKSKDLAKSPFSVWSSNDPIDVAYRLMAIASASATSTVLLQICGLSGFWIGAIAIALIKVLAIAGVQYYCKSPLVQASILIAIAMGVAAAIFGVWL